MLDGKVAIVTGATSDIGQSIAKKFVDAGAHVVMIGRDMEDLEKSRTAIGCGDATVAVQCDISDNSQVMQSVEQIMDKYGAINILVNNAAIINNPIHFHQMGDAEISNLIDVNVTGTFNMTKAVLNKMLDSKNGNIINIGSITSERAIPKVHLAVYSSTKAAITMFSKAIAVEYARKNIRCNCINLGIINSGMVKPYLDDPKARQVLEDRQPLRRIGEPGDVANTAAFLASDESAWITGAVINVDGGKSASEA